MMKTQGNKGFGGGPSGARSRDLRIKRPDHQGAPTSENPAAVLIGSDHREPRADHAKQKPHDPPENQALHPGAIAVVVDGLARGKRGRLVGLAKVKFGAEDVWAIELPFPEGVRCIRASFLRLEEP